MSFPTVRPLGLIPTGGAAPCGELSENARSYTRAHTVHHFNGDSPSKETDTLTLWTLSTGEYCFDLDTWGSNYHECGARGALKLLSPGKFLLLSPGKFLFALSENCTLTFEQKGDSILLRVSPGWRRLGEGSVCSQVAQCGMYGSIEPGKFSP